MQHEHHGECNGTCAIACNNLHLLSRVPLFVNALASGSSISCFYTVSLLEDLRLLLSRYHCAFSIAVCGTLVRHDHRNVISYCSKVFQKQASMSMGSKRNNCVGCKTSTDVLLSATKHHFGFQSKHPCRVVSKASSLWVPTKPQRSAVSKEVTLWFSKQARTF